MGWDQFLYKNVYAFYSRDKRSSIKVIINKAIIRTILIIRVLAVVLVVVVLIILTEDSPADTLQQ